MAQAAKVPGTQTCRHVDVNKLAGVLGGNIPIPESNNVVPPRPFQPKPAPKAAPLAKGKPPPGKPGPTQGPPASTDQPSNEAPSNPKSKLLVPILPVLPPGGVPLGAERKRLSQNQEGGSEPLRSSAPTGGAPPPVPSASSKPLSKSVVDKPHTGGTATIVPPPTPARRASSGGGESIAPPPIPARRASSGGESAKTEDKTEVESTNTPEPGSNNEEPAEENVPVPPRPVKALKEANGAEDAVTPPRPFAYKKAHATPAAPKPAPAIKLSDEEQRKKEEEESLAELRALREEERKNALDREKRKREKKAAKAEREKAPTPADGEEVTHPPLRPEAEAVKQSTDEDTKTKNPGDGTFFVKGRLYTFAAT